MGSLILKYNTFELDDFLTEYPRMSIKPNGSVAKDLKLEGKFDFTGESKKYGKITDCYHLKILIPLTFPNEIPVIYETGGRIPRNQKYHINSDGSLCLGSRLRILLEISKNLSFTNFISNCLVPYLFAVSYKLSHGGKFVFGELKHGPDGELEDYIQLFGLKTKQQAQLTLKYLGMKKRKANKLLCPCGCGNRLGQCPFNKKLKQFRELASRNWFRSIFPN